MDKKKLNKVGTGKAKSLNTQINNLKGKTIKENYQLEDVSTSSLKQVYKVTKK